MATDACSIFAAVTQHISPQPICPFHSLHIVKHIVKLFMELRRRKRHEPSKQKAATLALLASMRVLTLTAKQGFPNPASTAYPAAVPQPASVSKGRVICARRQVVVVG